MKAVSKIVAGMEFLESLIINIFKIKYGYIAHTPAETSN